MEKDSDKCHKWGLVDLIKKKSDAFKRRNRGANFPIRTGHLLQKIPLPEFINSVNLTPVKSPNHMTSHSVGLPARHKNESLVQSPAFLGSAHQTSAYVTNTGT